MLRRLAMLGLLMAAVAPAPWQAIKSAARSSENHINANQGSSSQALPPVSHPVQSQTAKPGGEATAGGDRGQSVRLTSLPPITVTGPDKTFWDHVFDWGPWVFDSLLVMAAGLQVWLLYRTWERIRRQADLMGRQNVTALAAARAAQTSAEAALKTVQVMIDSDRPWVIAHMEQSKGSCLLDNGNVRFRWTVKNVGKSPAKLIEAGAMVSLDTMGPPLDQIQYKMEALDERILVPGATAPFFVFWSIFEDGRIRTRLGKTLGEFNDLAMVYGCIRYRSAVDASSIYETRFSETSTISSGVCDGFELSWPVDPEDIRCT